MPFPTMPPIFQNRNNMSLIEDETIPETTPVPDTTTETNKEETTPVPDTATETNREEYPEILEIKAVETPIINET
jgi:hypothetical protein